MSVCEVVITVATMPCRIREWNCGKQAATFSGEVLFHILLKREEMVGDLN